MARNIQPKNKQLRRFGMLPSKKTSVTRKKSLQGERLEEKQKIKFLYGVMERQFRNYVKRAKNTPGNAIENLIIELERRLDNVVYRAGLSKSRQHARQLVNHGHIKVNNKKLDIPSYQISTDEIITVRISIYDSANYQLLINQRENIDVPAWLERKDNSAKILRLPAMSDPREEANYNMIFEFYR